MNQYIAILIIFNCLYGAEKHGELVIVNPDGTQLVITDPQEQAKFLEKMKEDERKRRKFATLSSRREIPSKNLHQAQAAIELLQAAGVQQVSQQEAALLSGLSKAAINCGKQADRKSAVVERLRKKLEDKQAKKQ